MKEPRLPATDHVPDRVLEELHGAFSDPTPTYDFDDPSIDQLLGVASDVPPKADGARAARQRRAASRRADPPSAVDPQRRFGDDEPTGEMAAVGYDPMLDGDRQTRGPAGEPGREPGRDSGRDSGWAPVDDQGSDRRSRRRRSPVPPDVHSPALDTAEVPVVPSAKADVVQPAQRRTVVIGGDDLPDIVYLGDEKDREYYDPREVHSSSDRARSTIVIDDLDEDRVIEPVAARVSGAIDPRISARRKAVRKAQGRKRLMWVGIGFGAFSAVVLVIALLASTVFDVRDVHVQGAEFSDAAAIDAVIEGLVGEPVLLVDTHAAEVKLESIPWVERAVVRTDFPHDVYIDIRERRAVVAFQGADSKFRVIDVTGRVLQVSDGQPADLLLIAGTNPNTAAGAWVTAGYRDAAQLVVALPTELRAITSFVGVDPTTGGLTITINSTVEVRMGNAQDLEQKLARLLSRVRVGLSGVCELDVSTAEVGAVPCPT